MNLTNLFTLRVRTEDFNDVAKKPQLLAKLRTLTLHPSSGMNHEMNHLLKTIQTRAVECKVILATRKREIVG